MHVTGNRLEMTLKRTAVRILKKGISKTVRNYELAATKRMLKLEWHHNILREQKLAPGISTSRLYDDSLKTFIKSQCRMYPSRPFALERVLSALASAVAHMHNKNIGHFDIKPANILIKWIHQRGYFKGATVVLADFGLIKGFRHNGTHTRTFVVTTSTHIYHHIYTYMHIQANIVVIGGALHIIFVLR